MELSRVSNQLELIIYQKLQFFLGGESGLKVGW